jgi:hypothetical protein
MPPRFDPADPLISNDYAGWWSRSFALLRAGWRPMAVLQLLLAVPILALLIPTEIAYERHEREVQAALGPDQLPDLGDTVQSGLIMMAGGVPAGLIFTFGVLAAIRLVTVVATGATPRVGEAVRAALRRLHAMLGWYVVAAVICIVAFALCFLPLIYVGTVLTILPAVVQLERGNAIARSFQLFHADLGAAVGRAVSIGGLSLAASVAMVAVTALAGVLVQGAALGIVNAVVQALYYVVSGLVLTPLIVTMYADLRARREPFSTAYLADPAPDSMSGSVAG